jgi:hypothetical protein
VDSAELDIMLEELETKVERLRALYEQYFMGIEKIPPQIVQKDVDRRLYVLRREQIRNTAKRFKLQTIIQRYNTFQQYWMRIMREIENGTYRRHVLRAERTVGVTNLLTPGERKRLGLGDAAAARVPSAPPEAAVAAPTSEAPTASQRSAQVRRDLERAMGMDALDLDALDLDARDLDGLDLRGHFDLGRELDDPLLSSMPPPMRKRKPTIKPASRRSARPLGGASASAPANTPSNATPPAVAQDVEPRSSNSAEQRTASRSLRPSHVGAQHPAVSGQKPLGLRLPATSAVAGRGLPPPPKVGVPRGAPPKVPASPVFEVEAKPKGVPRASLSAPRTGPPRIPRTGAPERDGSSQQNATPTAHNPRSDSSPPHDTPRPARARRSISPPESAAPGQPTSATKSEKQTTTSTFERPQPPTRGEPSRELEHARDVARQLPQALDRTRVEQLAAKLSEARQQTKESTAVSVDALAKKLETTADELSKKHNGRRIDFDVVIKNGKAIVKPIVR